MIHVTMMATAVWTMLGTTTFAPGNAVPEIHRAVRAGDTDRVKTLLAEEPEIVREQDSKGRTALHVAAGTGGAEYVELLIAHGSDVNAPDAAKDSPLHAAARLLHADGAGRLLRAGAHVDASNNKGETALLVAVHAGGQSNRAREPRKRMVKLLLSHGAAVDAAESQKMRPLHVAAAIHRTEVVGLLIEAKAKIDARDAQGRTATHWAAVAGDPAILELLRAAGADINATDARQETPLHCAARRGRTAATAFLLTHGAEVNALGASGQTPLLIAAQAAGHEEADVALAAVADLLCTAGADVHLATRAGATPLGEAQKRERPKLEETLRRHGATR